MEYDWLKQPLGFAIISIQSLQKFTYFWSHFVWLDIRPNNALPNQVPRVSTT